MRPGSSASLQLIEAMTTTMSSARELDAILRSDPLAFIERAFTTVDAAAVYSPNWHIEVLAYYLSLCAQKKIKRLIITLPPRSMKSICASVALPALILGKDPAAKVICASYAQEFSAKLARDCRTVMEADWFRRAFPATRIAPAKSAAEDFETTKGGSRFATSVAGSLTGRGANYIIIDDPIKADDADSETKRLTVNNWFDGTVYSRLNSKRDDVIVIVMQRLHMDDLVAHVLEAEDYCRIDLPAIATCDTTYQLNESEVYFRRRGELLHPARESRELLEAMRQRMGTRHFEAQYQQNPVPEGGTILRPEWFPTYDTIPLAHYEGIVQSWDTASKTSLTNDFSACTTWGIRGDEFHLLDVVRGRYEFPDLRRLVLEYAQKWQVDQVLIEDAASGTQLIQQFEAEGSLNAVSCHPKGEKVERVNGQAAIIEAGKVRLPSKAGWLQSFLDEVRAFPGGKYDDQVDSMSNFLYGARALAFRIKTQGRKFALRPWKPVRQF